MYPNQDAYGEMSDVIDGWQFRAWFIDGIDRIGYRFCGFDGFPRDNTARLRLCSWARHLHGNAPSGTHFGSYRVKLPNGKMGTFKIYI